MSHPELQAVLNILNRIIVGKPELTRLALACLLGRGHLLMEDLPGMGKTTLAQALARVLGPQFQRIQFTADLSAYYSRARQSDQAPVVYTEPKYVFKPKGAKPGMAIYKQERILWGEPQRGKQYAALEEAR